MSVILKNYLKNIFKCSVYTDGLYNLLAYLNSDSLELTEGVRNDLEKYFDKISSGIEVYEKLERDKFKRGLTKTIINEFEKNYIDITLFK